MLLTWIVFLPLLGMAAVLVAPRDNHRLIRAVTLVVTGVEFALTLWLFAAFDRSTPGMQFVERAMWIAPLKIEYYLGVDGLSVLLILLTGLLSFLAVFSAFPIRKAVKGFHALYLLLVTGMMGVFVSLDFFLFYVFWEIMLLPMYFLIGIWGGPRKEYAAIKFFLYTLVGSVLILIAMLAFYFKAGTFDMLEIIRRRPFGDQPGVEMLLFWALFIGFAIKVPIFPFHTWLPDAHVEAPTAISVILAGVLLKMGGYGFIRLNWPMCPGAATTGWVMAFLAVVALINIIYGALCAMSQPDFKKLVAYSSVSHMGYVLLGLVVLQSEAVNGAIFQMFTHGTSSAMMFMLVGVLYERAHHREIARFGGIGLQMPVYFALSTVGFFAALGLPGMSGFISEALVLLGSFKHYMVLTAVACIGIILTAGYILWTVERVYLGPQKDEYKEFRDVNVPELISLAPLAVASVLFGVLPSIALNVITTTTDQFIALVRNLGGM
ncbi:MAG: NADH-quinone oxidoreductase subunit M [Candidatus Sumerlaeia bacterium]